MKILWLDDIRDPFKNLEGKVPQREGATIYWVKSFEEFVAWIKKEGLPEIISFDHDLADEHYDPSADFYKEKTGMSCAAWLIGYCIDHKVDLPICYVHSANPVGAENIRMLLSNYSLHNFITS